METYCGLTNHSAPGTQNRRVYDGWQLCDAPAAGVVLPVVGAHGAPFRAAGAWGKSSRDSKEGGAGRYTFLWNP